MPSCIGDDEQHSPAVAHYWSYLGCITLDFFAMSHLFDDHSVSPRSTHLAPRPTVLFTQTAGFLPRAISVLSLKIICHFGGHFEPRSRGNKAMRRHRRRRETKRSHEVTVLPEGCGRNDTASLLSLLVVTSRIKNYFTRNK